MTIELEGGGTISVRPPTVPTFKITPPAPISVWVVPMVGPPGPAADEPLIDLTLLFDNAKA